MYSISPFPRKNTSNTKPSYDALCVPASSELAAPRSGGTTHPHSRRCAVSPLPRKYTSNTESSSEALCVSVSSVLGQPFPPRKYTSNTKSPSDLMLLVYIRGRGLAAGPPHNTPGAPNLPPKLFAWSLLNVVPPQYSFQHFVQRCGQYVNYLVSIQCESPNPPSKRFPSDNPFDGVGGVGYVWWQRE